MALRPARREDVRRIVEMLADDDLGQSRETLSGDMAGYYTAFDAIAADPNNALYVWEEDGEVIGCAQLVFLPGLSYQGAWSAQVEGVRVDRARRGRKIGEKMMAAIIEKSRAQGCHRLQLKSNNQRVAAHRFYERLGFAKSHVGMKLDL
ncbi:MAG: GNAT family N-acetyltransferase [Afipia sp.]|mgnify:CR=1 FL=1|nr:GNAT family N-acetyltransferase [Afipia sp.]OJW65589.1 MAG: GNAT family N-acetyltransferase [Afipia sp. 64-13]